MDLSLYNLLLFSASMFRNLKQWPWLTAFFQRNFRCQCPALFVVLLFNIVDFYPDISSFYPISWNFKLLWLEDSYDLKNKILNLFARSICPHDNAAGKSSALSLMFLIGWWSAVICSRKWRLIKFTSRISVELHFQNISLALRGIFVYSQQFLAASIVIREIWSQEIFVYTPRKDSIPLIGFLRFEIPF